MTCERCKDVHKAQKSGKTQRECKCPCHIRYTGISGATWLMNDSTATTSDFNTINFSSAASNLDIANTSTYTCTCITSSEQCDDCKNSHKCQDIHYPPKCNVKGIHNTDICDGIHGKVKDE